MEHQAGVLMINNADLPIRSYAHLGDSVYEVFVREKTIYLTAKIDKLHKITITLVNASYQADLLAKIEDFLTEEEKDIVRRARNLSVTTARRTNQKIHRLSTAFEALIGYLYLNNRDRLKELFDYLTPLIDEELAKHYLGS